MPKYNQKSVEICVKHQINQLYERRILHTVVLGHVI